MSTCNWNQQIFYLLSGVLFVEKSSLVLVILIFQMFIMFPEPTQITCVASVWPQHIGFSLLYGALLLKTWRFVKISVTILCTTWVKYGYLKSIFLSLEYGYLLLKIFSLMLFHLNHNIIEFNNLLTYDIRCMTAIHS